MSRKKLLWCIIELIADQTKNIKGGSGRETWYNSSVPAQRNCKYHMYLHQNIINKLSDGKIKSDIGTMLWKLYEYKWIEIIKAGVLKIISIWLVSIPPEYSISLIMEYLKGKSNLMIFEKKIQDKTYTTVFTAPEEKKCYSLFSISSISVQSPDILPIT